MNPPDKCKSRSQFMCCRCCCRRCLPRHWDPHGPWSGPRRPSQRQSRCVEQLLHATAHAERMPTLDALLLASAVSAGESSLSSPRSGPSALLTSSVCQIVNEPPPLWEVPSNCNNFTAKVFRAGLRKDSERRASAKALRRKTTKALRAGEPSPETLPFYLQFYSLILTFLGFEWILSIFGTECFFLCSSVTCLTSGEGC